MSNNFSVEQRNPSIKQVEHELWHGTSADSLDDINATGFNRSFCGKNGNYFIVLQLLTTSYIAFFLHGRTTLYIVLFSSFYINKMAFIIVG